MKHLTPLAVVVAAAFYLLGTSAQAYDEHVVRTSNGEDIFLLRFYDVGDGQYVNPMPGVPAESRWNLDELQKRNIRAAASYWAEIIRPAPGSSPGIVNIGTMDDANATAMGATISDDELAYMTLQAALQADEPLPDEFLTYDSHSQFVMGRFNYANSAHLPSQILHREGLDITAVAVHELGHLLGAAGLANDRHSDATPYFEESLTAWDALLVDDNGNAAQADQAILCSVCNNAYDPDAFDVRLDKAMLVGENIRDALEGGLPGLPVKIMVEDVAGRTSLDTDYMSHIELRNSLMSHQTYRNYTRLMEAELALMQDLGYTLDRRNFFGRSIYGSGLDVVNERGFYARTEEGTAYVEGQYNTATGGLGLHVYGSHNHVIQRADLLSQGAGGAGIRVDGEGNTIVIEPGVRVHAQGLNGQGVMFAYGKGHHLVNQGDIRATGNMGVGLRFDFGHSLMDTMDYRGSYIRTSDLGPAPMLEELQGPLADSVDITGSVAGSTAAIYISPNALVQSVNIMQGARIEGDIVSHYAERDETGRPRLTTISFGQRADQGGRATGIADETFAMRYADNIRGLDNLTVSLDGGTTVLDGRNELNSMAIQPRASLSGNGHFIISPEGVVRNDGLLSPGYPAAEQTVDTDLAAGDTIGRIKVDGHFVQGKTGALLADFAHSGTHDTLAVNGLASLDGTLSLRANPGWYHTNWALDATIVNAASTEGEFNLIEQAVVSPSIEFLADPLGEGKYRLVARRINDAYSQYAPDENSRSAGLALGRAAAALGDSASLASKPNQAAFSDFLTRLDFSSLDGSEIRQALPQISPSIYSSGVSASLHRERQVMEAALHRLRLPTSFHEQGSNTSGSWQGFASIFGGKADQNQRGTALGYDVSTYGLVAGATRQLARNPSVRVGGHLDIAHQSFSPDAPLSGKGRTTSFGLGLHAGYVPQMNKGLFMWGGLRFGLEDASLTRKVTSAGYSASHSADWTGKSASAEIGGGYRWQIASAVSAGPVASLNYAIVSRPSISEDGNSATRLNLDRERYDALRSSLGLVTHSTWKLNDEGSLSVHAQATWDREWMDRNAVQTAYFAAIPSVSFTSRNQVVPRDSLGLQAGLNYQPSPHVSVGSALTGRFGGGYRAVSGELRLRWFF